MRILYGIQGTGNGHLTRAEEIVPVLQKFAEVEVLVSGNQSQIDSSFPINYKKNGLTFLSSKKGKVDLFKTVVKSKPRDLIREIKNFNTKKYDLVVTDFEPVSAWSALINGVPCIELSHQAAVLNKNAPKPEKKDRISSYILNHYCPTKLKYGFHFKKYDENIFTPIIKNEIRNLVPIKKGYYTVYLPAFHDDYLWMILNQFDVEWQVFSKYTKQKYRINNIWFNPIEKESFKVSIEKCEGVMCGAGFELPSEALFLGKKVMVIPMVGQYEQECNAESLRQLGVSVLPNLSLIHHRTITNWLTSKETIEVNFSDCKEEVISRVLSDFESKKIPNESFNKIAFNSKFYKYFL